MVKALASELGDPGFALDQYSAGSAGRPKTMSGESVGKTGASGGATLLSLQYLRAIAAIGVVLFHAAERRGVALFGIGQMGVDIFFVLSGFLMWLISHRTPRTPAQFFADRLGRIAPVYWLATIGVLTLWVLGIHQGLERPEFWHTVKSLLFIPAEYPGKTKIYPLVIPGWTLNYEMFFYAIFALSLFARRIWRLTILTLTIIGLVAAGIAARPPAAILATYTDPIMLEFLAGVWLGVIWIETRRAPWWVCGLLFGAGVVLIPAGLTLWADSPRVVLFGAPALLIVAGAALSEKAGGHRKLPWLLLLGDASYSIYLWHFPTNPIWDRLAQVVHAPPGVAIIVMSVGGAMFGIAAYWLVEKPLRSLIYTNGKDMGRAPKGRPPSRTVIP
jgi:exopolysaccharide production protein ExoZ